MTYSIVARDKNTGIMGVGVQSHYFSVGSVVTWGRAGVGVVATQSFAEPSYGPLGLELMAAGRSAKQTLDALLKADAKPEVRQVAMVDSQGVAAVHTGTECTPYAGHILGDGFSVQANLMDNDTIWGAMRDAYVDNENLELPERILASLEAAEAAGGDIRGKQSAALLVVDSKLTANAWMGKLIELRVEDHPEPLVELRRLLRLRRAYDWADKGDEHMAAGQHEESARAFRRAFELAPELVELRYWWALGLYRSGRRQEAIRELRDVCAREARWKKLLGLLVDSGKLDKEFYGELFPEG
ncbi:MAG: DUF1028 domain-containing protein [Thermoprotei archaeon]